MRRDEVMRYRQIMERGAQAISGGMTDEDKLLVYGAYPDWKAGSHTVGEIYNADGQVWECIQAYDNAVYPDIQPEGAAWRTFNRPLHGTSQETARPYAPPTNATDIYRKGEYMIWTDGEKYRCKWDTAYAPDADPAAWEVI